MKTLKAFTSGDGAHCGLADWYPEKEKALASALKSGKPFDTGWYGSKKEIASARIYSDDGKTVMVEVSVSDDFDTSGMGSAMVTCEGKPTLEFVREAIYRAWDEAGDDQKENRQYRGYSVLHYTTEVPKWLRGKNVLPRERRAKYPRKQAQCVDTYLVNVSEFCEESPPSDEYHFWGWQSDPCIDGEMDGTIDFKPDQGSKPDPSLKIPAKVREKLESHAQSCSDKSLRIGDWEIQPWRE